MIFSVLLAALVGQPPHTCVGCDFAGAQLAGSDFTGATYVGTNFQDATLERASFRGARLVAANFEGADLRGAAFDGADCTACNFDGAKFDGATFAGVRMTAANFKGFAAAVSDAQLRELLAGCVACNFRAASLAGRDLSGIPLISVDFSQADLAGTKFDGASLCWYVVAAGQRSPKCDVMQGARTQGASFVGVQLCTDPSDVRTCTVIDADRLRRYSGSPLDGAVFLKAP
jgi:uncharacterized protein YjbI with pentapeptide repeats